MKTLILGLLVLATSAFAKEGGNGGGGHVCPNSVELYDFYEGKNPFVWNMKLWSYDPRLTRDDYLRLVIERIKRELGYHVAGVIKNRLDILNAISYNDLVLPIHIPVIADADIPVVDPSCTYGQVANWNDRLDRVFFSKPLYERMDPMNQAGLIIHEVLYKMSRELGAKNSDNVRKLVAQIFSDNQINYIGGSEMDKYRYLVIPKTGLCTFKLAYKVSEETQKLKSYKKNPFSIQLYLTLNPDAKSYVYKEKNSLNLVTSEELIVPCSEVKRSGLSLQSTGEYSSGEVSMTINSYEYPIIPSYSKFSPDKIITTDF